MYTVLPDVLVTIIPLEVPATLKSCPDEPSIVKRALPRFALLVELIDIGYCLHLLLLELPSRLDVIVTVPTVMVKLGPLGKVLGPRGLMPNPKTGTVTMDIKKAVSDIKGGKIDFKVEKAGIIHAAIGKVSFDSKKILENAEEFINAIIKLKPSSTKGNYIKSIFMSSTMSPSISIDYKI